MSKLYATGAILVLILIAWYNYSNAITDRDFYKKESETKDAQIANVVDLLAKKEKEILEANQRTKTHIAEKVKIENEAEANRKCIADRTCGFELRWTHQICANSMPNSSTSRPRADETSSSSGQTFEEWYIEVEEAAAIAELQIAKLQQDLTIRSNPNYCKPKQTK